MAKKFQNRKTVSQEFSLQITSMADIFMILLVFLLKSYSTSLTTLSPEKGTKLPVASAETSLAGTLALEVVADGILVAQKKILPLVNFEIPTGNLTGGEDLLATALTNSREKTTEAAGQSSTLVVLADERTPQSTIKRVLESAAKSGFVDLQLAVVKKD